MNNKNNINLELNIASNIRHIKYPVFSEKAFNENSSCIFTYIVNKELCKPDLKKIFTVLLNQQILSIRSCVLPYKKKDKKINQKSRLKKVWVYTKKTTNI